MGTFKSKSLINYWINTTTITHQNLGDAVYRYWNRLFLNITSDINQLYAFQQWSYSASWEIALGYIPWTWTTWTTRPPPCPPREHLLPMSSMMYYCSQVGQEFWLLTEARHECSSDNNKLITLAVFINRITSCW